MDFFTPVHPGRGGGCCPHSYPRAFTASDSKTVSHLADQNPALRADIEAHGDLIGFFYALDLDAATHVLRRCYRRGGPLAWDFAILLRILFLMLFERHLHFGAVLDRLQKSTLLRVLCGIDGDRVPGRCTVYDFLHRLPGFESEIRRERSRRIRRSRKKPKTKHRKGEKPPPGTQASSRCWPATKPPAPSPNQVNW